jgi:hypothetical protein
MRRIVSLLMGSLALGACDLDTGPGGAPTLDDPAVIEVVGGADQIAKAGTQLPGAIIVRISDSRKEPVSAVSVLFEVTAGEGSLSATTVKTDPSGIAQVDWTLGPDIGAQQIEARVIEPKTGQVVLSARIGATATAQ